MSFGSAISYVLSSIGKVFGCFSGLSYLKTGGINQSLNVVKANGTHYDMRNGQDKIYTGWSVGFWLAAFSSVLNLILTIIFDGFSVGGLISTLVILAVPLCIIAFVITLGKKNESHWKSWVVKVLVICGMISTVVYVLSAVGSVISTILGLIGTFIAGAAYGSVLGGIGIGASISVALNLILTCVVSVATNLLSSVNMMTVLQGMNMAVAVNGGQMGYNPNGQMNSNGYNPNGYNANGYNPNDYNPNMAAGVSGLGAVNSGNQNNINIDKSQNEVNQNMNQGFNGYNQNNFNQNYNQQNSNQNVNPQNVQMYACPYCGKAVMHGANPCPHCNNSLNWG